MEPLRSLTFTSVLLLTVAPLTAVIVLGPAEQLVESVPQANAAMSAGEQLITTGRVTEVHGRWLFVIERNTGDERGLLVLSRQVPPAAITGATVHVRGTLRPVDEVVKEGSDWNTVDKRTWRRFAGESVLVATSVEVTRQSELSESGANPLLRPGQEPESGRRGEPMRITLRPMTVVDSIDELAGQSVRILNARVVGVFEPRAFLIESATRYPATLGFRDRVLVLIEAGSLRVAPEVLVGSTVTILGVARSLLGARVSPELPWPRKLDRNLVERLEVRAAVLATSVQTPEGTELTQPLGGPVQER
jgi:hypothetical protein